MNINSPENESNHPVSVRHGATPLTPFGSLHRTNKSSKLVSIDFYWFYFYWFLFIYVSIYTVAQHEPLAALILMCLLCEAWRALRVSAAYRLIPLKWKGDE
ncbi:hypothetical protein [Pseudomonas sp. HLMP]|uniref:hypothetical protein n=1 Tax=Pseudomonas sp. HLMP TaxID=3153767 RepID=UPI003966E025